MIFIISLFFFAFGLIIGSFLNVVIFRMNTKRSLGGRSACMSCRKKLKWYELIPLLSYISLGGRCRNCRTKISIQYPLVEFFTGLIFGLLFLKFQDIFFISKIIFAFSFLFYALAFSILLVAAVYDIKHKIIPETLSVSFGILAFVGLFFFSPDNFSGFSSVSLFYFHIPGLSQFLSGIYVSFPFAILWFISRGAWMGFGDAKLALGIGWFLGLSYALSATSIAFWSGAIIGILLVLKSSKYNMKSEIPFAAYLVFGTLMTFLFEFKFFLV